VPETERMTLRRANWPDVDDVVAMSADAEVMRCFDNSLPMTAARVLDEEMPRLMADSRRDDELGSWIARERSTGNFLGWFMIAPVDESARTVELGYRLRRRVWGKGYGVEGMLQMIEMARAAKMSTVIATTMAVDLASRRVMEKAGLQLALGGVSTTPIAVAEPCEVTYTLQLSDEAALPAVTGS
jgi:RimJ/RimL family protein N-acetyltransferase